MSCRKHFFLCSNRETIRKMNIVGRLNKLFVEFWEQNLGKTNIDSLSFDITCDEVSFFSFCLQGDEEKNACLQVTFDTDKPHSPKTNSLFSFNFQLYFQQINDFPNHFDLNVMSQFISFSVFKRLYIQLSLILRPF